MEVLFRAFSSGGIGFPFPAMAIRPVVIRVSKFIMYGSTKSSEPMTIKSTFSAFATAQIALHGVPNSTFVPTRSSGGTLRAWASISRLAFSSRMSARRSMIAWVKPAVGLGKHATHPGGGDIIGYGNRNYVLKLLGSGDRGDASPYRLAARLDVNDGIQTSPALMADRWHHVALTVTPENGKRRMRLFLDGKPAADGLSAR